MGNLFKIIGKRIADKRKTLNYSQEYLAEKTGLHRNYIGYIERGEKHATIENIKNVAYAVGLTMEELFKDF